MRLIAVVLVVGLAACGDSRLPFLAERALPGTQLRVMSYNVNFGIAGDPPSIKAIADANPDLVFLQETSSEWASALNQALRDTYPHRMYTPPHDWPAGGLGVLSKAPLVSVDVVRNPVGPFFGHRVVVDTKLGRIQVLNVHLRPPMSDGGSWVVGYFSTRETRLSEIEHLMVGLDPKLPTLIVGDFNEEADGLAIKRLRELGYADAIAHHAGTKRTWEWPVGSVTLRFQLDHIFHDDHFIAVEARILEAGRSDHKPIISVFERMDP